MQSGAQALPEAVPAGLPQREHNVLPTLPSNAASVHIVWFTGPIASGVVLMCWWCVGVRTTACALQLVTTLRATNVPNVHELSMLLP